MTKSNLTSKEVIANSNNYTHSRNKNICKITPHHMAGVMTGEACAKIFQNANRKASANYCIGNDGEIVLSVPEEYRAWTSGSPENDNQAITIEVSNSKVGGDYPVSDKAWSSLVNLCVDICKRYDFRLSFTGDSKGSLTAHRMFQNTKCPGDYMYSRFGELASTVNSLLDNNEVKNDDITGDITYQVYDNIKKAWLPEVVNLTDYAGNMGNSIGGIRIRSKYAKISYQVCCNGIWLDWVTSDNYKKDDKKDGNSYAGIYGSGVQLVRIKSDKGYVKYRVHIKGGRWLSWVSSKDADNGTSNSYAGIIGKTIDAIEME